MEKLSGHKRDTHVPIRLKRVRHERDMRKTQRMMRDKKRKDTIKRASQPRTKQTRRSVPNRLQAVKPKLPEVHVENERIMAERKDDMEFIQVYTENYHNYLINREQAITDARARDSEEEAERERFRVARAEFDAFEDHQATLAKSLVQLCPTHGSLLPGMIRTPPVPPESAEATLLTFFKSVTGKHVFRVSREWKEFYHDKVKIATQTITLWPDTMTQAAQKQAVTDGLKRKRGMKCGDCQVPMVINPKDGFLVCTQCGVTVDGGMDVRLVPSFAEKQASSRGPAPYDRLAHVSFTSSHGRGGGGGGGGGRGGGDGDFRCSWTERNTWRCVAVWYPRTNPSLYPWLNASQICFFISASVVSTRLLFVWRRVFGTGIGPWPIGLGMISGKPGGGPCVFILPSTCQLAPSGSRHSHANQREIFHRALTFTRSRSRFRFTTVQGVHRPPRRV